MGKSLRSGSASQCFANRYAMFLIYLAGVAVDFLPKFHELLGHSPLAIKIQRGGDQLPFIDSGALRHCSTAVEYIVRDPKGGTYPGSLHPIEVLGGLALEVSQ